MSNLKDYVNKYSYSIDFDAEDNIYIARCAELTSISAHGKTHEEAFKEIKVAVLNALEWMEKDTCGFCDKNCGNEHCVTKTEEKK